MSAAGPSLQTCPRCGTPTLPDARVCGECGELLRGTHPSGALRDPPPVYATTDLKVGDVLEGKWRLDEIVGRGGMGAVFAATELALGRKVAVKALSANLAGEEFVSRFEREARVLGILHHPNIVTLHWVGRHQGVPFIVMNFLEGVPLRKWVDQQGGRVSIDGMLQIARPMCSALSYVHSKGVIHRDLKPSNIIVAPNGHVTVFDLGIARPHDSQLTKTGIIFGTPGYMSPELIVGEKNLDGRLDLYALAVILFEIVTGQSPFTERHEESLLRAHLLKPRPDASQIRTDLPPELGKVLQKAMALDPKDRYPDCDEFLVALETACGKRAFHEAATIMRVPLARDALAKAPPPPGMERLEPPLATPAQAERGGVEDGQPERDSTRVERGPRSGSAVQAQPESTRLARGAQSELPESESSRLPRSAWPDASEQAESESTFLPRGGWPDASGQLESGSPRPSRGAWPEASAQSDSESPRLSRGAWPEASAQSDS
ncbi:MAG: protein kinase, partial [Myxococcaceae bacterium]|nr:protein kinase [Myxococcaceae bacterium]